MRRKTFDMILTAGGAVLVVVLVAAGALALWGYNYANSNVHNQLASQQITFPTQAQFAAAKPGTEVTPQMIPYLEKYAGQQLLTGAQAEAYADHFIAYHLYAMPYHGVYATVSAAASKASAASKAAPNNKALATEATTLATEKTTTFQGTTLRGLLLEAYAFWTIGQVALWGAIIAFILAGIMFALTLIGVWHLTRVSDEDELFSRLLAKNAEDKEKVLENA
jgi:hypothetical protein